MRIFVQITFLLLALTVSSFGHDLLDEIKSKSKLIVDLKDVYRAFNINHIITDQTELVNLYSEESPDNLKKILSAYILADTKLKETPFGNQNLKSLVNKELSEVINTFELIIKKGNTSKTFKDAYEKYKGDHSKYMDYLISAYPMSKFVNMTEDVYWKNIDRKNYIDTSVYFKYKRLEKEDPKKTIEYLGDLSLNKSDFQKYSIYEIEAADQYVKKDSLLNFELQIDTSKERAIAKYAAILNEKKYSIYLYETWMKWRVVSQYNAGLSKSSEIPNAEYDAKRIQVAAVILNYIAKNPKDEMAINQFLVLATHDIIRRFGSYPYGNQCTIEYHETFDE